MELFVALDQRPAVWVPPMILGFSLSQAPVLSGALSDRFMWMPVMNAGLFVFWHAPFNQNDSLYMAAGWRLALLMKPIWSLLSWLLTATGSSWKIRFGLIFRSPCPWHKRVPLGRECFYKPSPVTCSKTPTSTACEGKLQIGAALWWLAAAQSVPCLPEWAGRWKVPPFCFRTQPLSGSFHAWVL